MNFFKNIFKTKLSITKPIPKNWIVYELYQEPLFTLWDCTLLNLKDKICVYATEMDSLEDAIKECVNKIKTKNFEKVD